MANLIYSAITSLDGYVADEEGNFDWAAPDGEVHAFVSGLERPIGTYLYGRRMYEVMTYWETAHAVAGQPPSVMDYAGIWQAADKVVYSKTLVTASTAKTRAERDFDPEEVRDIKASADRDLSVGGSGLAARAIEFGRRAPSVHHADRGGRRQEVVSRWPPYRARARGRTPFRQRRGVPPLPH
jgi:dihydrofolate reductase